MTHGTRFEDHILYDNRTLLIGGCTCRELVLHSDDRGVLYELIKDADPKVLMSYFSHTNSGYARDATQWHLHEKQIDRFVVLYGCAIFALSDGEDIQCVKLYGHSPRMLVVPSGVYHCFKAGDGESVGLVNFPTELYNPDDELRISHEELGLGTWSVCE